MWARIAATLMSHWSCLCGVIGGGMLPLLTFAYVERATGGDGKVVMCEHPWLLLVCVLSAFVTGCYSGAGVEKLLEPQR